jgi:hypothetical protein
MKKSDKKPDAKKALPVPVAKKKVAKKKGK